MRIALKRTILCATAGLVVLFLAPFALAGLDRAMIAIGMNDDEAAAVLPDPSQSIAIKRRPIWSPVLGNEFRRSIHLSSSGRELLMTEIEPDTGGYALMQLFETPRKKYLLTDGISCYQLDLLHPEVRKISVTEDSALVFVGAFDEESTDHHFQFVSSAQRSRQPFGYTSPDWCLREERK